MEGAGFEEELDENGKGKVRISKIPLEDILEILEKLYESGVNYVDFDFYIDPDEVQSVITISTKPEYISTPEELEAERLLDDEYDEEEEDDEDPILSRIKKEQEELDKQDSISDDDINNLI